MRRLLLASILVSALALGGCTTSTTSSSSSSKKFTGAQADVATAVSDLQKAAQRKDGAKICSELLAKSAVDELGGPAKCPDEINKATTDSDEFSLEVQDVTVNGDQATAKVRQGKTGKTKVVRFVKEGNSWKLNGLASG
jgi:uncharacterized low-complexity protein